MQASGHGDRDQIGLLFIEQRSEVGVVRNVFPGPNSLGDLRIRVSYADQAHPLDGSVEACMVSAHAAHSNNGSF